MGISQTRASSTYYGWWVVSVLAVVELMVYGAGFYAFTLFMKPLATEFGWSRSVTSGSVSMFWISAPLVPLIGLTAQRIDARWLIVVGVLLEGLCFIAVGGIDSAWELYALRAAMGLGKLMIAVTVPVVIARWFYRRAGLALGVAYSGSHFGGFVLSPLTQLMITHFGWRPAAVALGVVIPLVVIPSALWLLRFRNPAQLGLERDGSRHGAVSPDVDRHSVRSGLTIREVLQTKTFWILLGLTLIFYSAYASIMIHESAYLTDLGLSPQVAANLVGITQALAVPSVLLFGVAIDRWHPRGVLASSFALLACAIGALLLIGRHNDPIVLVAFVSLFGLAIGGVDVVFVNTIRLWFGDRDFGVVYSCWYFVSLATFVIAPVVTGRVYDVAHDYSIAFIAAEVGAVVGLLILVFARLPKLGQMNGAGPAAERVPLV